MSMPNQMINTLLNAVSATTPVGPTVDLGVGITSDDLALDVFTNGTVSAFSVQLQGSIDGVDWANIGAAVSSTGLVKPTSSTSPPCEFFRANLPSYTGTGTVTAILAAVPFA